MVMHNLPRPPGSDDKPNVNVRPANIKDKDKKTALVNLTASEKALIPDGSPEQWVNEDWESFSKFLDALEGAGKKDLADALEQEAWERVGIGDDVTSTFCEADYCTCPPTRQDGLHDADCLLHDEEAAGVAAKEEVTGGGCTCESEKFNNIHVPSCSAHVKYEWSGDKSKGTGKWSSAWVAKPKCKHDRDLIELLDGLSIYASAWRDVKYVTDERVDIGIYCYSGWQNGWAAVSPGLQVPWAEPRQTQGVYIDWPDYSIPNDDGELVEVVKWVLEELRNGTTFEAACLGGHGRTGTFIACLLVAQGISPGEAIEYVREKHCKEAIESSKQVDYVAKFYETYHGHENWRKEKRLRKLFNRANKNIYSYGFSDKSKTAGKTSQGGGSGLVKASDGTSWVHDPKTGTWVPKQGKEVR